jgi:hypothetical protein
MTIEEARLRFPPGTVFDNRNIVPTSTGLPGTAKLEFDQQRDGNILVDSTTESGGRTMYTIYNAKMDMWANIIHTEGESAPVNNYSIY